MTEQRILVVSPSWVGDMVMSQTLYSLLKKRNPNVQIDVMAPGASKPLLSRMAHVHQSVLFDVSHGEVRFGYRARFAKSLRSNQYDQAIVLPNSLKSALVPFLANIPVRTGYRGEMRYILLNDIRRLDKARLPRMIDRFMSLGLAPGGPLPEYKPPELIIDQGNQEDCLRRFGLDRSSPTLGICPGAEFGDAKRWPEEKFSEVAQGAIEAGMQVWLFGSAADRLISQKVVECLPQSQQKHCKNLAGRTTLLDAIDLLNLCPQVLSNDSGLMHIAAAVGCRTLVLYGSSSPDFTPPLTLKHSIIRKEIPCSPCFKRECPLGHKNCLNLIASESVLAQLEA